MVKRWPEAILSHAKERSYSVALNSAGSSTTEHKRGVNPQSFMLQGKISQRAQVLGVSLPEHDADSVLRTIVDKRNI